MRTNGKSRGAGQRAGPEESTPPTAVFTTAFRSNAAELVDFSATGARLRGEYLPDNGEELLLSIKTLRVFGIVAWVEAGECASPSIIRSRLTNCTRLATRSRDPNPDRASSAR